jgi:hypothetical protein
MIHTQEAKEPKEKIRTSTTHCSCSGVPNQWRSWPTSRNLAGEILTHTGTKIGGVTKSNPKWMPASFQLRPKTEYNNRALRASGETQERTGAAGTKTRASGQERNRFWCGKQDPARARQPNGNIQPPATKSSRNWCRRILGWVKEKSRMGQSPLQTATVLQKNYDSFGCCSGMRKNKNSAARK